MGSLTPDSKIDAQWPSEEVLQSLLGRIADESPYTAQPYVADEPFKHLRLEGKNAEEIDARIREWMTEKATRMAFDADTMERRGKEMIEEAQAKRAAAVELQRAASRA